MNSYKKSIRNILAFQKLPTQELSTRNSSESQLTEQQSRLGLFHALGKQKAREGLFATGGPGRPSGKIGTEQRGGEM